MRTRQIVNTSLEGGKACDDRDSVEVQSCNMETCESINCEWTAWGDWGACDSKCQGGTRTRSRSVSVEARNGGDVCDASSGEAEECNLQPCTDQWTAGAGADIAVDGITFQGEAANAVVTSQKGVESISVKNGAVIGSVQIGLAQDDNPDFATGKSVVLPYKGATDSDEISVGVQDGRVKVFKNGEEQEDLGNIGPISPLKAKIILDQGASVKVDAIATPGPAAPQQMDEKISNNLMQTPSAPSWTIPTAVAAASLSMMAAVAYRRSHPTGPAQQPLLH